MSTPEIDPHQRDMLHASITARLTGVSDVFIYYQQGNFEAAQRLSGELSDDLRVLHDDLGWGGTPSESIRLKAPQDVWERTLVRIQERARSELRRHEERASELEQERQRIEALEDACGALAEQLTRST
jgi:hypothetical protein